MDRQNDPDINPWIGCAAMQDERLNPTNKDLLFQIVESTEKDGYCYKKNRKLAKEIDRSIGTVNKGLVRLQKFKYIFPEYHVQPNPTVIRGRVVRQADRKILVNLKKIFATNGDQK